MTDSNIETTTDESEGLSDRWRTVWSKGSYGELASNYAPMAGQLVEKTGVSSTDSVLDVGCGTGTVAITAARCGAQVTGVEITPTLLEQARGNAEIAGRETISWQEGDATALPLEENSFDITVSNLGHIYGDPPEAAAKELCRVTRPGGRIGFTAWTLNSLYPSMAGVVMTALSPSELPDLSEPPFLWGDRETVRRRLDGSVDKLEFETKTVAYRAVSPEHFWRQMSTHSGMFIEAFETVEKVDRPALREQLIATIEPYFDEQNNAVELEYLLTTATVTESE